MPHDAEITRQEVVTKDGLGGHDLVLVEKHEAPAADDGGVAHDPYQRKNAEVAATMMKWLQREYPGHPWGVIADLHHRIVKFNIPILMGMENWWIINLTTHDIIDGMRLGAGQILERYGLRRGRFELVPFLEARAKHSALVDTKRLVPDYFGQDPRRRGPKRPPILVDEHGRKLDIQITE